MLRFEAITHNTKALGCGRVLDKFPDIVARLAGMLRTVRHHRWTASISASSPTACSTQLPRPTQIGATRVGGVDLN